MIATRGTRRTKIASLIPVGHNINTTASLIAPLGYNIFLIKYLGQPLIFPSGAWHPLVHLSHYTRHDLGPDTLFCVIGRPYSNQLVKGALASPAPKQAVICPSARGVTRVHTHGQARASYMLLLLRHSHSPEHQSPLASGQCRGRCLPHLERGKGSDEYSEAKQLVETSHPYSQFGWFCHLWSDPGTSSSDQTIQSQTRPRLHATKLTFSYHSLRRSSHTGDIQIITARVSPLSTPPPPNLPRITQTSFKSKSLPLPHR
jgi:hypothetical protein